MTQPAGESDFDAAQLNFDRRPTVESCGASITYEAGLLACRELDDALWLTALAGTMLSDGRRGGNTRHLLTGLLRQSVFSCLTGYKDINNAERLACGPAIRWVVGGCALMRQAASKSQIGRFETDWPTNGGNLAALTNPCGQRIDRVHGQRPPKTIVLDMDSICQPDLRQSGRAEHCSPTSLKKLLVRIGVNILTRARYVTLQMAEMAIPRQLFAAIPCLIDGLRPAPA